METGRSRIAEEVIHQIRDRTDIVEVVGRHVQLKRAGANYKGLCPFHEEKTPSFNVNADRQFFHCFGCQAGGDVISFLMRVEGRTFTEVVEDLARRAGIEIPRERLSAGQVRAEQQRRSDRQRGLELNEKAARAYAYWLRIAAGEGARQYILERGISDELVSRFQLGFAPPSGQALVEAFRAKGIDLDVAERIGLVARRSGGTYRDRFWNRIVFPLVGPAGEVLGFAGRVTSGSDAPKYVNTPETPLYRKGESLYGLAVAAPSIRRLRTALLVEGNFDVIQLHQHGFDNAVAPLGTALTTQQARLLKRFAETAIAIFDGDKAGRLAAQKAVKTLIEGGLEAKIGVLPTGTDPDSLLREQGRERMQEIIDGALPAVEFLISDLRGDMENTIPGRARVVEQVAPVIALLPSRTVRQLYADQLALEFQVDPTLVKELVRSSLGGQPQKSLKSVSSKVSSEGAAGKLRSQDHGAVVDRAELEILKLLVEHPRLFHRAEQAQVGSLLTNAELRVTYSAAAQMQRESGELDATELLRKAPPGPVRDAVAEAASSREYARDGDPTRALDDCVITLADRRAEKIRACLGTRIQRGGANPEPDNKANPELERLNALTKIRSQIRNARSRRDAEAIWALVPELVEVEREIHETQ